MKSRRLFSMPKGERIKHQRFILALLVAAVILCGIYAIQRHIDYERSLDEPEEWPLSGPACVCWKGELYAYENKKVSDITAIGPIIGTVTSVISSAGVPLEDGQANCSWFQNAPFAEYDGGLALLIDDEWLFLRLLIMESPLIPTSPANST